MFADRLAQQSRQGDAVSVLRYITHPNVAIDAGTPVPEWGLSALGRRRAEAMLEQPWASRIGRVVSSAETKALETAAVLAARLGLEVESRPATGENDRSATGFVLPAEFERLADAFFARPEESVEGWERAVDAQARIVVELADVLASATVADSNSGGGSGTDIAVVGHGGVGTLWYCHLTDQSIERRHDQPGQGHYFALDLTTGVVLHPWRPIDLIES